MKTIAAVLATLFVLTGCTNASGVIAHREYHHTARSSGHWTLTLRDGRTVHVKRKAGADCVPGTRYPDCLNT